MNLEHIEDSRLYKVKELSEILRGIGIPHNIHSIRKYKNSGLLKLGRIPHSRRQIIFGSEIKNFIHDYLKEAGAI